MFTTRIYQDDSAEHLVTAKEEAEYLTMQGHVDVTVEDFGDYAEITYGDILV